MPAGPTFAVASALVGTLLPDAIVGPRRVARMLCRSRRARRRCRGRARFLLFRDLTLADWRGGRRDGQRVVEPGPDDWSAGRRDALLVAGLTTFVALAFTGWGVLAYVLTGLAFAVLLLASVIATITRRRTVRR